MTLGVFVSLIAISVDVIVRKWAEESSNVKYKYINIPAETRAWDQGIIKTPCNSWLATEGWRSVISIIIISGESHIFYEYPAEHNGRGNSGKGGNFDRKFGLCYCCQQLFDCR